MNNKEIRSVLDYQIRAEQETSVIIEGYIAKFDSPTELFEGFYEKINRHAFDKTLSDGHNVFLLYHHDWSKPLASTELGTLTLKTDDMGLRFTAAINKGVTYMNDTIELVKSGLCGGCSFGFICIDEDVNYNHESDTIMRELLKVELLEGSILCIPAYKDTNVYARCEQINETERQKLLEQRELVDLQTELELLELENAIR